MTRDIDLVVALRGEDARRLASVFADDYYVPDNIAEAMVMPGMRQLLGRDADMAYLAHWAPILGVSDWLERLSP